MNIIARRRSFVLLIGLAAFLASPTHGTAGIITTYLGAIQIGNGGGAWSYGHEATSHAVDPNSIGYDQYTSGAVIFALDPITEFNFTLNDMNGDGLSNGDTLGLDFTIGIFNFTGSIFSSTPITLGAQIGSIRFYDRDTNGAATLTVGGSSSSSFDLGISGMLDFDMIFTADADKSGQSEYKSGETLEGTAFFQAASYTSKFSGISATSPTSLEFAIWGDNRDSDGNISGTHRDSNGDIIDSNRSFGFDIVVEANAVPEPSSLALLSMGAISLMGYGWRRKRKPIAAH